jgi:hypothetical protein
MEGSDARTQSVRVVTLLSRNQRIKGGRVSLPLQREEHAAASEDEVPTSVSAKGARIKV